MKEGDKERKTERAKTDRNMKQTTKGRKQRHKEASLEPNRTTESLFFELLAVSM